MRPSSLRVLLKVNREEGSSPSAGLKSSGGRLKAAPINRNTIETQSTMRYSSQLPVRAVSARKIKPASASKTPATRVIPSIRRNGNAPAASTTAARIQLCHASFFFSLTTRKIPPARTSRTQSRKFNPSGCLKNSKSTAQPMASATRTNRTWKRAINSPL